MLSTRRPDGTTVPADSTDPQQQRTLRRAAEREVPYLPSADRIVTAMLDLAAVTPDDVVYDLGCGDGRIVIEAARRGARGIGVDIDLKLVRESYDNAKRAGVGHRAKFVRGDVLEQDLRGATVVAMYLLPSLMERLVPKLRWELRPGARIVSNYFDFEDWPPDATANVLGRGVYKWIIPAWVQGEWSGVVQWPDRRERMGLQLHRRHQRVWGEARVGGKPVALTDPVLVGDRLTFTVAPPRGRPGPVHYACRFDGGRLRGTCRTAGSGSPQGVWGAVRR